jgi:DNA mismatch endonuclease (patch repair protein)
MRANRSKDTKPELALRQVLHRHGYRYRVGLRLTLPGRNVRPDIVFTKRRVAVFIDGCFWHSCPEHGRCPSDPTGYWRAKLARNRERDTAVDEAMAASGWTVVRIWEHEPSDLALARVSAVLNRPDSAQEARVVPRHEQVRSRGAR